MDVLYIENDNLLTVDKLKNIAPSVNDYVNDAAVTVTLQDGNGNDVNGQSFPRTLSYVSGSNGQYVCTLEDTLDLSAGVKYTAIISVDAGAGLKAKFHKTVKAQKRSG